MKLPMLLVLLFVGTVVQGCANREGTNAVASADIAAVKKTITDLAKAVTEFPRTRDKGTVLRFATNDYVGITDGEWDNTQQIEEYLLGLLERMNLGDPIGISYEVTGINVYPAGTAAWASYQYAYKLGRGGLPLDQRAGMCTAIFRKKGKDWLYRHAHWSRPNPPVRSRR